VYLNASSTANTGQACPAGTTGTTGTARLQQYWLWKVKKRHCWDSNILGQFLYLPTIQDLPVAAVCARVAVSS